MLASTYRFLAVLSFALAALFAVVVLTDIHNTEGCFIILLVAAAFATLAIVYWHAKPQTQAGKIFVFASSMLLGTLLLVLVCGGTVIHHDSDTPGEQEIITYFHRPWLIHVVFAQLFHDLWDSSVFQRVASAVALPLFFSLHLQFFVGLLCIAQARIRRDTAHLW